MQRQAQLGEYGPLLVLQRIPLGVLLGLLQEGATSFSAFPPRRAPPSPAADSALATDERGTLRTSSRSVPSNTSGRTMFTMIRPTGSLAARSSAIPSAVSWTGISSRSVTRCTAVSLDFSTRITACA